jgi:hypothetical protein
MDQVVTLLAACFMLVSISWLGEGYKLCIPRKVIFSIPVLLPLSIVLSNTKNCFWGT